MDGETSALRISIRSEGGPGWRSIQGREEGHPKSDGLGRGVNGRYHVRDHANDGTIRWHDWSDTCAYCLYYIIFPFAKVEFNRI